MTQTHTKSHRGATDPDGFDTIVREVFAPIYPVIAEQIVARAQIRTGRCLDAGCGTGALGRAVAQRTSLHITFFDQSETMLSYAERYAKEESLETRSTFMLGDIHTPEIATGSMDLVVSRGSSPFWADWEQAYGEILRILREGGKAYIGGGFGTAKLREQIVREMHARNPQWQQSFHKRARSERDALPEILKRLGPSSFEIIDDESGHWVLVTK